MIKLLSRFIFIIIFFSCSKVLNKYPAWYLNPPKNDSKYLYGVGEGFDPEEAKTAALNDVASRMRTDVSSKTVSGFDYDNLGASSTFSQKISANVDKISFNNYQVLKLEETKGTFKVMIGVNSDTLIKSYKNDIESVNSQVKSLDIGKSNLEKRENLAKILHLHSQIEPKVRILESIDETYDIKNQLSLMSFYIDKFNKINSQLNFHIFCEDSDIKNALTSKLTQQGIKISDSGEEEIKVDYKWVNKEAMGVKMAKLLITLKYIDNFGKIIKSSTLEASGKSYTDYSLAKKNAVSGI